MNSDLGTEVGEVLPSLEDIQHARLSLLRTLPGESAGLERVQRHIVDDLVPGFNRPSKVSTYYGFVTGQLLLRWTGL